MALKIDDKPIQCIPLSDYKSPSLPTPRALQYFMEKTLARIRSIRNQDKEKIATDKLHAPRKDWLDTIAKPPAYTPILKVLDTTLKDWAQEQSPLGSKRLVVLPPCEAGNVLEVWAKNHGFETLPSPSRSDVFAGNTPELDIAKGPPLILSRLEDWYVRTPAGLKSIRALLRHIHQSERKILIGANPFAWEFLKKSVDAHYVLPDPVTPPPLQGEDLRNWFHDLSSQHVSRPFDFKLQKSGKDIFDLSQDKNKDYFNALAAKSLGIPWVAWYMWRDSLLTSDEVRDQEAEADDTRDSSPDSVDKSTKDGQSEHPSDHVLWVSALEEFSLPGTKSDMSLLVLQALLIHGSLSENELIQLLPEVGPLTVLPLLTRAGIVTHSDNFFRCKAEAYPAIYRGLKASGFPVGNL